MPKGGRPQLPLQLILLSNGDTGTICVTSSKIRLVTIETSGILVKGVIHFLILFLFLCQGCMGNSSSQDMSVPPPVVVEAVAKQTATLIFLHGLGDTGHGWAQAFRDLGLKHIKYICPTAPLNPVTLNGGMRMPSWFDIFGLRPDCEQDVPGIKKASDILKNLISEEEKQGIQSNRIMVGGFSQGGAVSLYTAFTLEKPLAGIIGLSTWMPLHKEFDDEKMKKTNTDIPILQCHGHADPLVPYQWGERTSQLIKKFSKCHIFKGYQNMAHSSCEEEMNEVKNFLQEHLSLDSKV